MTIREAIKGEVLIPGIPDYTIDKAAADLSMNATEEYNTTSHKTSVVTASLAVLKSLKGLTSLSEGGFSISLNPAAIEQRIKNLENGTDDVPKISDASGYW